VRQLLSRGREPPGSSLLVTCAQFIEPVEAQIVRARLESEGIPAFVADELLVTANWPISTALGGVRVQVPPEYLDEAREIVAAYFQGQFAADVDAEAGSEPHKCPACGSESFRRSVPFGQKALAIGVFAVGGATFPTRCSSFRCTACGKRWEDEG
jgi:hypothetical protein